MLERVLEKAQRVAQEAEVFHLQQVETPVHFEANRVKSIETRELTGAALRIVRDGRVGFSSTTNLGDLDGLVSAAVETAPFGAEARLQFPGPEAYPEVPVYDAAVGQTSVEQMVQVGQGVVDGVRAHSAEVQVEGGVSRSVQTVSLMNTRGGQFQYTKTTYGLGFEGTLIRDTDMLFVFDALSSCHPLADGSQLVTSMVGQLEHAKETVPLSAGTMPVLFTPFAVAGVLLSPLLAGLNGKAVLQGTSPLVDRLGERIVDQRFTLTDDPTIPSSGAAASVTMRASPAGAFRSSRRAWPPAFCTTFRRLARRAPPARPTQPGAGLAPWSVGQRVARPGGRCDTPGVALGHGRGACRGAVAWCGAE